VTRVVALILHARAAPGAGPLTAAFDAIRRRNADRQAEGFRRAGADAAVVVADGPPDPGASGFGSTFGARLRDAAGAERADGIVVLGSGSIPLATATDRRAFVAVAGGPRDRALANNRYSADVIAIAGTDRLRVLPDLASDNGLPRWLADSGEAVNDLRSRWRLQVDLDSPLDALLVRPGEANGIDPSGAATAPVLAALERVAAVGGDPRAELVVAGRASAAGLAWLERSTRSRTRALIEERGFRTRPDGQRPPRSSLGLLLDRDGPDALGAILAELGDAALVDSRVLLAHRFGTDESAWPAAEDRFASDLLLAERIADPWLARLTRAARDAAIPIVLGGHSLVGPGLRLALGRGRGG
jgi:hypothetical protein